MNRAELTTELMTNFMLMKRRLYKGLSGVDNHNVTPVQMQIFHLISTGSVKIADIAKELGTSGSAVSQHVNLMVAQGWLIRAEGSDRRETHLSLSSEIAEIVEARRRKVHADMLELTGALTEAELRTLVELFQKLNQKG